MMTALEAVLGPWLFPIGVAVLAVAATLVGYRLALAITRRFTRPTDTARLFLDAAAGPIGASLCLMTVNAVLQQGVWEQLPLLAFMRHTARLLLILALTWAAVRCVSAIGDVIVRLNPVDEGRWRRARKVETQTRFLVRALNILVVIIGAGVALMTFEPMRQFGASLLASAGIGGIVLGFAARPVLGNLLAGMQIALTEPFRIDDVLNVEGEWCWVEEVTATYVVLRVWDLRRIVMPLQWFIEHPFENWTRHNADLMGAVTLWVDYAMPVEPLRGEFSRLLAVSAEWDGKTESVQVMEAGERGMQVRFLMSAGDSTQLWNLRCAIRESLVAFMNSHYPGHLPRMRAELVSPEA
ncbi:mechanosensitive ion channel family protein [Vreelandella utahensis]|uniref:mechanosensitive ion channel family protein n=1 Tax=Vreelandella halophila TaxID=86177 RepID=UPI0009855EA2|nr:mechanosensitive ion channel family protein [Halomonas utahensis]